MSAFYADIRHSQNFLKEPRLVAALLERSSIGPDDVVYEIGAGRGIITEQLAERCGQVIAIELDPRLAAGLRGKFAGLPHVTIWQGDCLTQRLPQPPYKVFANIPFAITAAVIERLTPTGRGAHEAAAEDAYLVVQKEAAETLVGGPRVSLRSVLLKPWFDVEIVHHFRRTDFAPAPRVDAVMLRLRKRGPPLVSAAQGQAYRDFVTYGFTAWRPALGDTLRDLFTQPQLRRIERELGVDLRVTPTMLPVEDWLRLFDRFMMLAGEAANRRVAGSERRLARQQEGLHKVHRTRITPGHDGTGQAGVHRGAQPARGR